MAAATTPPILTNFSSNQLECTLHCPDYHCLLRLWSAIGGANSSYPNNNSNNNDDASSSPDIASIAVIPIDIIAAVAAAADQESIIHLLPMLHKDKSDQAASCDHPCHELIRISHKLQVQLKERLQDASHGAITNNNNNNNGTMEDFLLRSEAVFHELLSAVKQQSRREEASRYHTNSNNDRQNNGAKKRARITSSSSTTTATTPPPLEYYHALLRQLHTLQNMPNVTDITLHKDNNINSSSNSNNTIINDATTTTDLTRVSITCQDNSQRSHTWHAELYPTIVLTVDLPAEFALEDIVQGVNTTNTDKKWWTNNTNTNTMDRDDDYINDNSSSSLQQRQQQHLLPRIQQHLEQTIHNYQSLFDELDDLDSNLWILEPTLPARRSCVERRIALWEGGASVVIVLDHEKPRGVPIMVRFLGVTMATIKAVGGGGGGGTATSSSVADWRASFAEFVVEEEEEEEEEESAGEKQNQVSSSNEKKKRWSGERSIRENLELWLGSPLPSPLSTEKSDYLVECGICYSHRLPMMSEEEDENTNDEEEGPLPEEKCSNSNCNRYYHESCLFEWLHSLPTARVSFDRIFGNCPYCCESVSVKVLNQSHH